MKIKKLIACVAAVATMATMFATGVSAADWSQAGYADNDPGTVKIISTDANSATFTAGETGCKLRITVDQVLANPDDAAKIKSGTWKVTYAGFTDDMDFGWMGGGAWMATTNSTQYGLSPAYTEDGAPTWTSPDAVTSIEDSVKYLLPGTEPAADGEFVFMDWSGVEDFAGRGLTITISDLKLFDADGNELAQKTAGDAAPAGDDTTTSTGTGNTTAAAIVSVMAVAAAAAIVSKKRK